MFCSAIAIKHARRRLIFYGYRVRMSCNSIRFSRNTGNVIPLCTLIKGYGVALIRRRKRRATEQTSDTVENRKILLTLPWGGQSPNYALYRVWFPLIIRDPLPEHFYHFKIVITKKKTRLQKKNPPKRVKLLFRAICFIPVKLLFSFRIPWN